TGRRTGSRQRWTAGSGSRASTAGTSPDRPSDLRARSSDMCTYTTERIAVTGSAKGPQGWFRATTVSVYYDHPVHAQAAHSLNIDFLAPDQGPSARVALELTADTA